MMEHWYICIRHLLPFQWVQFEFMMNALLAIFLAAPVFGVMGTMVVNNRMAFFSEAIGHAALTGIALGVILGLGDPLWAMIFFAAFLAAVISWARIKTEASPDTVIGVFFAATVALGIVILSHGGGFNKYTRYLIGDLLSITPQEMFILFIVFFLVFGCWGLMFNKLFLASFNPAVARSRGIRVPLVETFFSVMLAVIVTVSIQWVGILIINSLLILPAAASRNLTGNMRAYHLLAIGISLVSGLIGLILSYYWGTATGATIVLCASVLYLGTIVWKARVNKCSWCPYAQDQEKYS
jgi:zinc transport system permease protein